jgi:hypothetical protein
VEITHYEIGVLLQKPEVDPMWHYIYISSPVADNTKSSEGDNQHESSHHSTNAGVEYSRGTATSRRRGLMESNLEASSDVTLSVGLGM